MGIPNLCRDHKVERFSDEFWKILKKYARVMANGRQNTFWFIYSDFFSFDDEGNIKKFDKESLKKYIQTFLDEGLYAIQGAPFLRRRNWVEDAMLVSIPSKNEIPAISEKGKKLVTEMLTDVIAFLKENGWENRWLQGVFDEPTEKYVERYKEMIGLVKSLKPDIRILEATMTMDVAGLVNYWCPQVQEYQHNRSFFDERKKAGDKVWVYTCLAPGGPWINRLVDQERLRPVYIGWARAKYDLHGYLHWGFNKNRGNPFTELVRFHTDSNTYLPAGDSHIVYALGDELLSSQRFEAHRIGMEDYELLIQLKKKNPALCMEIINSIFKAFDDYSKNVLEYRKAKRKLLDDLNK